MLIVSRKTEESVVVGDFDGFEQVLKVTVLDVRGQKVRLGFEVVTDDAVCDSDSERPERLSGSGRNGKRTKAAAGDNRRTRSAGSRHDQSNGHTQSLATTGAQNY